MARYHYLFSYGTLSHPQALKKLCHKRKVLTPAILENYCKIADQTPYYCLQPEVGATVTGSLMKVTDHELLLFDRWEEVPLYTRQVMQIKNFKTHQLVDAFVYNKTPVGPTTPVSDISCCQNDINETIAMMPPYTRQLYDVFFLQPVMIPHRSAFLKALDAYQMTPDEEHYLQTFTSNYNQVLCEEPLLHDWSGQIHKTIKFDLALKTGEATGYLTIKSLDSKFGKNLALFYLEFINISVDPIQLLNAINTQSKNELTIFNHAWIQDMLTKFQITRMSAGYFFINCTDKVSRSTYAAFFQQSHDSSSCRAHHASKHPLLSLANASLFGCGNVLVMESKQFATDFKKRMLEQWEILKVYEMIILNNILPLSDSGEVSQDLKKPTAVLHQKITFENVFNHPQSLTIAKKLFEHFFSQESKSDS